MVFNTLHPPSPVPFSPPPDRPRTNRPTHTCTTSRHQPPSPVTRRRWSVCRPVHAVIDRHRVSERGVYRAGLRGAMWTASTEARVVLYRQLLAYNETVDGIALQVSTAVVGGRGGVGGDGGQGRTRAGARGWGGWGARVAGLGDRRARLVSSSADGSPDVSKQQ